jgi:hypothetical protein
MTEYKKYTCIFVLIFLASCANNESIDKKATNEKNLQSDSLVLKGHKILSPSSMSIVDSTLFFVERGVSTDIISYFSLEDFTSLGSFGKRGRGPNEFSQIIQHSVSVYNSKNNSIQLFDWVNKRISFFDISTLINAKPTPDREYTLPPELMLAQRAAFLDDTTVVASGGIFEGVLAFADVRSDEVTYIDPYNIDSEEHNQRVISSIYKGEFSINYDRGLIAFASNVIPEILLFDFSGKLVHRIAYNDYDLQEIITSDGDKRDIYFQDINATSSNIYATYIGKNFAQLEKSMNSEDTGNTISTRVIAFNWDGNISKKYNLEDGYFPFIEVDENHDRLFSINRFSPSLDIVYFEM